MTTITKEKSKIKKDIDKLPAEIVKEIGDFIEFLKQKKRQKDWIEFDEWALNLAKEKGFSNLTEKDISDILSAYRES